MSHYKTKFCWWPVRLARHVPMDPTTAIDRGSMEFIGWVWMQEAHLTRNYVHGWVAFLDSKPPEMKCKTCGQTLRICP